MRPSPSLVWIAIACSACSKEDATSPGQPAPASAAPSSAPSAPSAPEGGGGAAAAGPARPGAAAAATAPSAPAAPAPAPSCTRGEYIESFEPSGGAGIACFIAPADQRDCWRIDAAGAVTALPPAQWPAPGRRLPPGDARPPMMIDGVQVRAPAPLQVKLDVPYDAPSTIEVCNGAACKRLKLRRQQRISLQQLHSVTVLDDGRTLFAGLGLMPTGAEAIDRYDLDHPAAAPQRLEHPGGCAEILDVLAGNLLVQTTGCVNAGGDRVIVSPAGKHLANLHGYASDTPYYALGGNRWLFAGYDGYAIWDFAKAKRIGVAKGETHAARLMAILAGGALVAVDGSGKIFAYDATLQPTPLGAVPRCP